MCVLCTTWIYLFERGVGLVRGPVVEAKSEVLELDVAALEEGANQLAPALQVEVHQLHLWRGRHP